MSILESGVEIRREIRMEQGFPVYCLSNDRLAVSVLPALGARVLSLRNRRTGREWMWHPTTGLKLHPNRPGDDFALSPLTGLDECLPTIAPCALDGRAFPDHGEAWSLPWSLDMDGWGDGLIRTGVELRVAPLRLERTLELHNDEIRLAYRLSNLGNAVEPYLWAMHPLLTLQPGDHLELPAATRNLLEPGAWIDDLHADIPDKCIKAFAWPLSVGTAAVKNRLSGDYLEFRWNPAENAVLGIWLSRGGWHGHHQFAIEPSNGLPDSLAEAAERDRCGRIPPGATLTWHVSLRVGVAR